MSSTVANQLTELTDLVSHNCKIEGEKIVLGAQKASYTEMRWLQHLETTQLTGTADCLIEGTKSAIREAAACVSLGLVRPALNSLRIQIDLILGWLYFKDHPIEWARVQATGDGFKMKSELLKYLTETYDRFGSRFGTLRECKTRTQDDPYRLLSAHLHGQSESVLPQVNVPSDIVASAKSQDEFLLLQAECAEFLNDVMWSVYADRWSSIPTELYSSLVPRFKTANQRATFFA